MQISIVNGSIEFDGNQILSEINFDIHDKEKIALVGRNGCGKTSLIRAICGEVELVPGGAEYDLISGECLNRGSHKKIQNKTKGFSAVYQRLLNAVNKLVFVVKKMQGRSNKELEKVTKQIEDIIDKCE